MKKYLLAGTAAIVVSLATATAAKAFVPIVLAAIIGGSVLAGALAVSNSQPQPQPQYATPTPAQGASACYLQRHNGHLVKVCD